MVEFELKDHYGLLGISIEASPSVIKSVYRRLALKYHPDKNIEDANAQENFKILQDAYATLSDPETREDYDIRAQVYGTIPSFFLPAAPIPKAPKEEPKMKSKNEDIKEAFRKARIREKLEAERIRVEKEKFEAEEAARRVEEERLQAIAAERIRAAREAQRKEQEKEGDALREEREREWFQHMASQRIRAEKVRMAREEEKRREQEQRWAAEEQMRWGQEIWEAEEEQRRQDEERWRREEEEFAEKMRKPKVGRQSPKGEPPNCWGEEEIRMLVLLKENGMAWSEISLKLNGRFRNGRGKDSCRKKYVKLRDNKQI